MERRISDRVIMERKPRVSLQELERLVEDYLQQPSAGKWQILENCMFHFAKSASGHGRKHLLRIRLHLFIGSQEQGL